ncbi:type I restriction-modification system subunit M [Mesomycoplasma ovipneumoniae]|uniref:type I restriction-modification system subunit M n=1 Tax=Mesomycoplasma ovipneumoniae TaxID=29562 RepID=UPI0028B25350|nr:class I SAM-dependent DNA methyltransferase [Mesomycoplasma ovipneumoniae]MDW2933687.1 class I SAM-dependent DNA methyltransferase [Mesomycoplasma ovipneumoniae]WNM15777.1 class I SAM-dependent DNA methyltransferase [Mesomycoplasma ovipneumoniae]
MESTYSSFEYNKLISFIWSVADDCLRDVYVRGKYRDVILPMTLIKRFDSIIEPEKANIMKLKEMAEKNNWDVTQTLNTAVQLPFYNISNFCLKDLKHETNRQNLKKNFEEYLNGFSENVKEILQKFDFNNQLTKMTDAGILGSVIEKFTSSELNLSPYDEKNSSGDVIKKGLDNHAMGTLFEEIIRKFNEENNEEAGEHFTPRDVIELMADIAMYPIIDKIKDATYSIYDGACGTLGMGTVAEERLKAFAKENGKEVSIHLIGQEVNAETYAIAKADLLIKGGDTVSNNVYYGSTLSDDRTSGQRFDFMLSNPPYGKTWKTDLAILGNGNDKDPKKNIIDRRFVRKYKEQNDFRMIPDVSDGQLLFLLNNISKMKETEMGSRIVEVHNGSALFTGDAGNGASNARRFMIEEDLIEAIIQLPENMFYNTGITTYIWILSNRKEERRKGKIQLINANSIKTTLRKNMGKKNCEFSKADRKFILNQYLNFEENEYSKIFLNDEFGYYKVVVERPLRQAVLCNAENLKEIEEELKKIGAFSEKINKKILDDSFIKGTTASIKELEKSENLEAYLEVLKLMKSDERYLDYTAFEKEFNKHLKKKNIKGTSLSKFVSTGLLGNMIIRDENAAIQKDSKGNVIVDPNLRDTESIPMTFEGGIEEFIKKEVLPYHADAFVDESKTQIGYEINFTKYFYKAKELERVEDIVRRIKELERQSDGLMTSILEFYE